MTDNINSEKASLAQNIGGEIVFVQAPDYFNRKAIECFSKGFIYIPIDKIVIYGTGKVQFPDELGEELQQLKKERAGQCGKEAQRAFSKDPKKTKRIQQLEAKLHNYQRSQGNRKSLIKAGIDPDSLEDAFKIISHLIDEVENLNIELEVGITLNHVSRIEAPNGQMVIESKWQVKSGKLALLYLNTIIYSK